MSGANDENELQEYMTLMKKSNSDCGAVWLPLSDEKEEGVYRNTYTGMIETYLPWAPNQPNGGKSENYVLLLLDVAGYDDNDKTDEFCVSCTLDRNITFRRQGLSKQSYLGDLLKT